MSSVTIKLRPTRLAFLVDISDKSSLLEAIAINTFLWGGVYNPIIPFFNRTPKGWEDKRLRQPPSKEIIEGYLDAFDPDLIVSLVRNVPKTIIKHRKEFSSSEILANVQKEGVPRCGIGLFEILRFFIKKELKFTRQEPLDISLFNPTPKPDLFLASVFGILPKNINDIIVNNFAEALKAQQVSCDLSNYAEFMLSDKLFLRRFTSLYMKTLTSGGLGRDQCVFLMDASKTLDIIDYWNLRAVGWNVLPVPKQAFGLENVKKLTTDFIEENFFPYRGNPNLYHHTNIVKSRSLSEEEVNNFVKLLRIAPSGTEQHHFKYSIQRWYPRIWDEWARDKDGVVPYELEADSIQHELTDNQNELRLKMLTPKFIDKYGYGKARFVNEIKFSLHGGKEPLAEVIPEGDETLVRAIGGMGFEEWRFSKRGIAYLSSHANFPIYMGIPKAEAVFSKWLEYKKWSIELSPAGRIAKQMLKQLGGVWGVQKLANEGLIQLLDEMSSGKTKSKESFWADISKIANQEEFIKDPIKIAKDIMDSHMFRLGVEVQCPVCRQHSWYSIDGISYDIYCTKCREQFSLPTHSPEEIKWSYSSFGPFSLPNKSYGSYGVLLTLRFFSSRSMSSSTTPIMSFLAQKGEHKIEADLGILFQTMKFGNTQTEIIFAKCKSYNNFKKVDADRMKTLAEHFPGAILVFSTLNRQLTEKEKAVIRPVVNRGRRYWKSDKPYNPILILTGTELFSNLGPPQCWKNLEGKHKLFANDHTIWHDLRELCDVTQQIYLDMKPWHEWIKERWDKKRQRRIEKQKLDSV